MKEQVDDSRVLLDALDRRSEDAVEALREELRLLQGGSCGGGGGKEILVRRWPGVSIDCRVAGCSRAR